MATNNGKPRNSHPAKPPVKNMDVESTTIKLCLTGTADESPILIKGCDDVLLAVLCQAIERRIAGHEKSSTEETPSITPFHALRVPSISVVDYTARLLKYALCSKSVFLTALIYLERIGKTHPSMKITSLNVHRLLITSVMVAAKFWDDTFYTTSYYAKVGGISVSELNTLEIDFLFKLDFRLVVTKEEFAQFEGSLIRDLLQSRHPRNLASRERLIALGYREALEVDALENMLTHEMSVMMNRIVCR